MGRYHVPQNVFLTLDYFVRSYCETVVIVVVVAAAVVVTCMIGYSLTGVHSGAWQAGGDHSPHQVSAGIRRHVLCASRSVKPPCYYYATSLCIA